MGWFSEQIKERKKSDSDIFEDCFVEMAGAILGSKISQALNDDRTITKNAIEEILKYYHIKSTEIPENIVDMNDQLEFLLKPCGVMRRKVSLTKGWYKNAIGAYLGTKREDGSVVAIIPYGLNSYAYKDNKTGKIIKLGKKTEGLLDEEAIAFYMPFPLKKMDVKDLLLYIAKTLSVADYVLTGIITLIITLIGLLTPKISQFLYGHVVDSKNVQILIAIMLFMFCVSVSSVIIGVVNALVTSRINTRTSIAIQAATMSRIMSLSPSFFKNYSSGDLCTRAENVSALAQMLISTILSTGLTSLFSLIYIGQIFEYAPTLVIPALIIIAVTILFSLVTTFAQMNISKKQMELSAAESGMNYSMITGVQKIKLSGAEKRVFARWGKLYAKIAKLTYNPPMFLKINGVISTAISVIGTIVMYYLTIQSGIGVSEYIAFTMAYGMVSGSFISLSSVAMSIAEIKPIVDMTKPILESVPEVSVGKQMVTKVNGSIEMNNVSFRYNENMPLVLDGISLKIRAGQFVAIVGSTGCGKSTLMRLLLGFENPQKGAIYYDGKDLSKLDLNSLRKKIGTVMQNGKLFQGDIYSNIVISALNLTMDEAWEAAELSGIADDIRKMPMGMHTIISEGSGGVSGGQRQRLMIARAIAPKPKILMLDEATSALDNITQKIVTDSLNTLKSTRIVIAHRLSTIKECDRIIYLDKGKIIEDGTYDELIAKDGAFAQLVERQRLDK